MPSRADRRFVHDLGVLGLPGDASPRDVRFEPANTRHLERLADGRIRFTVWAEPDLTEAWLVGRAPDGAVTGHRMTGAPSGRFGIWSAEVPGEVFEYSFAFRSAAGRPVYVVPTGVTSSVERLDRWRVDPAQVPVVTTPDWVKGAVIYQIFPDRFANGDTRLDPPDLDPWGTAPHPRRFQGGDLVGVIDRLGYLADLGVDALYLNPVFASPSNHRYDAVDYYQVDPALGGNDALRRLVDQAHRRGLRIILDASFNHVHPGFFAFQDLLRRGRRSVYRDWFEVRDWPVRIVYRPRALRTRPWVKEWLAVWRDEAGLAIEERDEPGPVIEPTYDSWYSVPTMPRVVLAHPEARAYMLEVAAHWVREYGIDGWRMDVARYVDHDFWNDLRAVVKAVDPDAYLLAEIVGDTGAWLQGDRFDATMNYGFRSVALRFFARDEIDGAGLLDASARLLALYPESVNLVNQNLLGSHDTPRFLTEAGGQLWRLRLATVFQLAFPGAPGLYYGDEVGLAGGDDPGSRGAFPWAPEPTAHPLHRTVRELVALRRRRRSLRLGTFEPIAGSGGVVAFRRRLGRESTTVVINRGRRPASVEVGGARLRVRWGEADVDASVVTVGARAAAVLW